MAANSVLIVDGGSAPPPPINWPAPKRAISLSWETWDGRRYNLSNWESGVFLMGENLEGLGYPTIQNFEQTSPAVHGSTWAGWLATGRKVFWTVGVYHNGTSEQWIQRNRAFMRSLQPGKTGRWVVELPTGERLGITLRYKGGLDGVFQVDPAKLGWQVYGIEFMVEQPFWEGDPIEESWSPGADMLWAGPTGFGPPWNISSSQKLASATLNNPGDIEAYPEWELRGPFTSASFGLGSNVTPVPFALTASQSLVVTTDPRTGLTAELNGTDVMERLPGFSYPQIPPGQNVKLTLTMEAPGTGARMYARFRPLYFAGV